MPKPNSDCRATECKHPWPMVRLGDVCGTINGIWKGLRKPFVHVGIIRSSNITKNCEFSLAKTIYIDVEEKKYKQRKLLAGDIIVERSGGGPGQPVGRAVYFDLSDGEYSISNFTSILRVKDANALNGKFLQLYLTSQYFQGATENIQSNTTGLHNLDFDAYLNFKIPLPPLSVQREIVARLERELAAVEKMKKGFETLAETAKAEFKAELKEVFEEISRGGAEMRRLGEVCERLSSGKNITAKRVSKIGEIPVYGANGLRGYTEEPNFEGECCVIGRQGALCGNVKYFKGRAYMSDHAVVAVFKPCCTARFMLYQLDVMNLGQLSTQAAQPGLSVKVLSEQDVFVPPLADQREVVARLDSAKARADKLEAKAREGVAVCETMRKAILKEAFE